jgi:hypothetical protein
MSPDYEFSLPSNALRWAPLPSRPDQSVVRDPPFVLQTRDWETSTPIICRRRSATGKEIDETTTHYIRDITVNRNHRRVRQQSIVRAGLAK